MMNNFFVRKAVIISLLGVLVLSGGYSQSKEIQSAEQAASEKPLTKQEIKEQKKAEKARKKAEKARLKAEKKQKAQKPIPQKLEWQSMSRALEYKVEIKDATGAVVEQIVKENSLTVPMYMGDYEWRVTAFDFLGRESTKTDWRRISIKKGLSKKEIRAAKKAAKKAAKEAKRLEKQRLKEEALREKEAKKG